MRIVEKLIQIFRIFTVKKFVFILYSTGGGRWRRR